MYKTNLIEKEMNADSWAQDPLNTNEPTMPYVKSQEINLQMCWVTKKSTPNPLHQQPAVQF